MNANGKTTWVCKDPKMTIVLMLANIKNGRINAPKPQRDPMTKTILVAGTE